jgi:hypothetical protein
MKSGRLLRSPLARSDADETAIGNRVYDHAQGTMIVVAQGDEAKWLKHPVGRAGGIQHFRHPMDWTAIGLKSDFDEVSLMKRFGDTQKPSGHGYGLQFAFGALAVFHQNQSCNGTA